VVALWAEQDVILADEFRDGNVPAGSGNRRVVERALAALPVGVDEIRLCGDSALYEQALLRWLEARRIGYAISADMSRELAAAIRALPETAWQPESEDAHAVRQWAEVSYVPSDGVSAKDRPAPPRYLAIRITRKQGELFADGNAAKHFAIVTNLPDPESGSGLDLIRWQRAKAGTIEHTHHVLTNELAAEALPSQRFGANTACAPLRADHRGRRWEGSGGTGRSLADTPSLGRYRTSAHCRTASPSSRSICQDLSGSSRIAPTSSRLMSTLTAYPTPWVSSQRNRGCS
jgi:hypothetical protein